MDVSHMRAQSLHHIGALIERTLEVLVEWNDLGLLPSQGLELLVE